MLTTSRRSPYICWRCIARGSQHNKSARLISSARLSYSTTRSLRNTTPQDHASSQDVTNTIAATMAKTAPRNLSSKRQTIHDRLRAWAAENKDTVASHIGSESRLAVSVANSGTRSISSGVHVSDLELASDGWTTGVIGQGADVDIGTVGTTTRNPGDLIEIRSTSHRGKQLAIYLGFFHGMHHFYTSFAKWMMARSFPATFSVARFASFEDLEPIFKAIPNGLTTEEYGEMQRENKGPTREDGAAVLAKMQEFRLEADRIWLNNIEALEGMADKLPQHGTASYLSLFDIARSTLPKSVRPDGTMSPATLYSVLEVIEHENLIFHPLSDSDQCQRRDYLFEILPETQISTIKSVANIMRDATSTKWTNAKVSESNAVYEGFVARAQEVVAQSRKARQWTTQSILQPTSGVCLERPTWSKADRKLISFLHWWAVHDLMAPDSAYHAIGSSILRGLDLYPDVDLDQSLAWTFLQEIGHVAPWEIPGRYQTRLPGTAAVRGGGLTRDPLAASSLKESMREDLAAQVRQDTGEETVFCIDKAETTLIDDGISLERTENDEEFWIHVHAADIGAEVHPRSRLDAYVETIPDNIYLTGHFQSMLPSVAEAEGEDLADRFSLEQGKPALTFSAKVNLAGEILDYKIEPRRLRKVANLDPVDVATFCNQPQPPPVLGTRLVVGELVSESPQFARDLPRANDLDEHAKDDLRTLHRLSEALKKRRARDGAWPFFPPRPAVNVRFNREAEPPSETDEKMTLPADPRIEVGYEDTAGNSMVANTMVLAGQIATMWCAERGIPAPFRKNPHAERNWDLALEYVNKEIIPSINTGKPVKPVQMRTLNAMIGSPEMSTEPGPYLLMGLTSGYMKVTSPLRRYADLVAHWQIHAALAHERAVGRKIDPGVDDLDAILPWGRADLTDKLQLVEMREKMVRKLAMCNNEWILMAVARALSFEGGLPDKMTFTVSQSYGKGVVGTLDYFDLTAILPAQEMDEMVLIKDLRVDDQFEVEIADVNVLKRAVTVRAVRYLGRGDSGPAPVSTARGSILGLMSKQFGPGHIPKKLASAGPAEGDPSATAEKQPEAHIA